MSLSPPWQEPVPLGLRPPQVTGFRLVDEILARRGFVSKDDAQAWLKPDLEALAEGVVVAGIDVVVARIHRAVSVGERIVIFGDYDCDGITSTAILLSALSWALKDRATIQWRLPRRADGYGLRESHVQYIAEGGPGLLIAVDCGSNDLESIAAVRSAGMDVVVIDHHQLSTGLPDDVPLANPQLGSDEDAKSLTAAGLSWLVVRKLAQRGVAVGRNGEGATRYLELATLGTIGDVAQLRGLNRAIVREGIEQLRQTRRPGLRALARVGKFDLATLTAEDVPFNITPRLNAPGRLDSPDIALMLLLASDWDTAQEAATEIAAMDQQRKLIGELILAEAIATLEAADRLDDVIVISGDTWHTGLLGPVATKLAERFGRPAIVVGGDGDALTGSGRSIAGWDMAAAFQQMSGHLGRHGGHSGAAGLSMARDQLVPFRTAINEYMAATGIVVAEPDRIEIDADVGDDEINYGLVKAIEAMSPFGRGNPRPVVRWRNVHFADMRAVGRGGSTAQLSLLRGSSRVSAVMFGGTERLAAIPPSQPVDVLLRLCLESWNGRQSVKGRIVDVQLSG